MCGIAGVLEPPGTRTGEELVATAAGMAATLQHRGPDDQGVWVDAACGVALGHRRLAIMDLSPRGHQPMRSRCGRYTLVFNGEIYNFRALRAQLLRAGWSFRGDSDTEVLLTSIAAWGLDAALQRCNGMFGFALWDQATQRLHLARDRLGEKPLYYGCAGRSFLFGSELKALRAHPAFTPRLDLEALDQFLRVTYVPTPRSIYEGVHKLPPGCLLTVAAGPPVRAEQPIPYWSFAEVVERGRSHRLSNHDRSGVVDEMDRLLRDAVRLRMESDVPLGAFLSGGIDSSVVVAAMQAESSRPVRTFTVSFAEASHDEAAPAAAVAQHLGTDHTEVRLSPGAASELIPRLPDLYDEPFADPSQLPTHLIAAAARAHLKVCLSGDGGDEIFGGYNRYVFGRRLWRWLRPIPRPARAALSRGLLAPSHAAWHLLGRWPATGLHNPADKVQRLALAAPARDADDLYRRLILQWDETMPLVRGMAPPRQTDGQLRLPLPDPAEGMMALDTATELPDCMLTKVDRASMGVGLEVRVPLLDHRLVEFAWRLPLHERIDGQYGKVVLRQLLDRYVPRQLVDRPKMGFDPPVGAWLRGPLREWAEELLSPQRLRKQGILEPGPIRIRWREHLTRRRNWDYPLWTVLMFQSWYEQARPGLP